MFEITGSDIQQLADDDLRTLVARLATAELRANGLPISGITAGGNQDAPDGGLDVRIELQNDITLGDFVPRTPLGFQVKRPDLPPAAILSEMKPGGHLRAAIGELANHNGAYIIVSSHGSVADKPLQRRREAMRDALDGHPSATKLHLDFYDRDRLANWVNQYPGVAAWTRARIGRALAGWQSIGDWSGARVGGQGRFVSDEASCLLDARTKNQTILPVEKGIDCIREALAIPGQCIRLIGMSGVGKTRLVQALFEDEVGSEPLEASLAIYTDYSETPDPTAKQLALQLLGANQRAILIVDNCNPQTHNDLAKICGGPRSNISLITVEYDVRDDVPERTEVFRLQSASEATIVAWIEASFPIVSQVDRDRIAEFSGGNFRVAGVLADTIKQGDSLGDLRDRDLFLRIFQQRNDSSPVLLEAAEALSLVYSFDGDDTSASGELAQLAPLATVEITKLYASVAELKRRGLVQSRGRWRAILPQAIANRLAAQALERMPPDQFDAFCADIPQRMQKSVSRRLGYLHDKPEAQRIVAHWLARNGPMGNLLDSSEHSLELLRNVAPVAPNAVLARIEEEVAGGNGGILLDPNFPHRWQITNVIKSLAFDETLFDRAAALLAQFVAAEPSDHNHNSARGPFEELFQLHLSGTQATPGQRRATIKSLCESEVPELTHCGLLALGSLLKSNHFSATSSFEFGARPRDFGWHPPTYGDIWDWFSEAISLASELARKKSLRPEIRHTLAGELRGLIPIPHCLDQIEAAVCEFLADGEWLGGWFGIRAALRFDRKGWSNDVKERASALEAKLRPSNPLSEARAYVLEGRGAGYALMDGDLDEDKDYSGAWERASERAREIGRQFGLQDDLLSEFLPEALQSDQSSSRLFPFGMGLAESGNCLADMWAKLRSELTSLPVERRNATVLAGFIRRAQEMDSDFTKAILDSLYLDRETSYHFVYLQAQAGIDAESIERLRAAIISGIDARQFYNLATGVIRSAPQDQLALMLEELSALDGGTSPALDILHMAIYCLKTDKEPVSDALFEVVHKLLLRADYSRDSDIRDHRFKEIIKQSYVGEAGESRASELCRHLKELIETREVYAWNLEAVFEALFSVQPAAALNEFLSSDGVEEGPLLSSTGWVRRSPLEQVPLEELWSWADKDPTSRYPQLGKAIPVFATRSFEEDSDVSSIFAEALERSPNRKAFLEGSPDRLGPSGWSGSLSVILERRKEMLARFVTHEDVDVRAWAAKQSESLARWAQAERDHEGEEEESFE